MKSAIQNSELGPFRLLNLLGQGSTGQVWLAEHRETGGKVALKFLQSRLYSDAWTMASFERELRATAQLYHPNIATLYDYGELCKENACPALLAEFENKTPFLVMEYVDGIPMGRLRGKLRWQHLKVLFVELLQTLAHAHARGVVHRDIKPSNIMLFRTDSLPLERESLGSAKLSCMLLDFGLALHLGTERGSEGVAGTPSYMAPELWRSDSRLHGPWTDLYCLGCVLWTMCTGVPPFGRGEPSEIMERHLYAPPPNFSPTNPVPGELHDWLCRLLSKELLNRYSTAADALSDLLLFVDSPLDLKAVSGANPVESDDTIEYGTFPLSTAEASLSPFKFPSLIERSGSESSLISENTSMSMGLLNVRGIPIIGRNTERSRLWSLLGKLSENGAQAAIITGVYGSGCSRLAQWLCEEAQESGVAQIYHAFHSDPTNDPLADLIRRKFLLNGLSEKQIIEQLGSFIHSFHLLPEQWSQASRWLSGAQDAVFSSSLEKQLLTMDLLLGAGASCFGQGKFSVVWIDDSHRDPAAIRFCRWVLRNAAAANWPIFFIITLSDEQFLEEPSLSSLFDDLIETDRASHFNIAPLSRNEQREVIARTLGLAPTLSEQILDKSGGNSKVARELIFDCARRSLLESGPAGYDLKSGISLRVPSSLGEVWERRILELFEHREEEELFALELGACLGQIVSVVEWEKTLVIADLKASERLLQDFFRLRLANWDSNQGHWRFRHPVLVEALRERSKKKGRWRRWNRTCAQALDCLGDRRTLDRQGRHRFHSGDFEAGICLRMDHLKKNGEILDREETDHHFNLIHGMLSDLGLPEDHELWQRYHMTDEHRQYIRGNMSRVFELHDWLGPRLKDPELRARFLQHKCYALSQRKGMLSELSAAMNEGFEIAESLSSAYLEEIFLRVRFDLFAETPQEQLKVLNRAKILLEGGEVDSKAEWYWHRSWGRHYVDIDDVENAQFALQRSLDLAIYSKSPARISSSYLALSEVLILLEKPRLAHELAEKSMKLAARANPILMNNARINMGWALFCMGESEQSLKLISEALNSSKQQGRIGVICGAQAKILLPLAMLERWDEFRLNFHALESLVEAARLWKLRIGRDLLSAAKLAVGVYRWEIVSDILHFLELWWRGKPQHLEVLRLARRWRIDLITSNDS